MGDDGWGRVGTHLDPKTSSTDFTDGGALWVSARAKLSPSPYITEYITNAFGTA